MPLLFLLVMILVLVGEYYAAVSGNYTLVYIAKPLMMPILMVHLYSRSSRPLNLFVKLIMGALFFSWLGDLLLMLTWSGPDLFVFGLSAFLIAHVFYIIAFRPSGRSLKPGYLVRNPLGGLALLAFCAGLIYWFFAAGHPDFAEMKVPVIIYTMVILTMALAALDRKERVSGLSFHWIFWGAVLFMLSDSMIAVNKFTPFFTDVSYLVRVGIMLTYGLAQYMIVHGTILLFEKGN